MKLFFATNLTQLFAGNAKNLDQIEDNSIDMIIADAPYGINYVTGHRERSPKNVIATLEKFDPIAGDKNFPYTLMRDALWEMHRVLRHDTAAYLFTRWDCYHKLLPIVQETFGANAIRNVLTWAKNNWTAGDKDGNYAYQTEIILYVTKGRHKLIGKRPTNLLPFKRVDGAKLVHPAQKPIELLSFLIAKSCPEDGIILDPFLGCGSTCVAATNSGKKSIGVDIDERWLNIAKSRLEHKSFSLFDQVELAPQNFSLFYEGDEIEAD